MLDAHAHQGPATFAGLWRWIAARLALLGLVSCSGSPALGDGDRRVFTSIESFLDGYWLRPIPFQGAPPRTFAPVESSLSPGACATCHPAQYADWETSAHAQAFSPGLAGQLVNWEASSYQTVRSCLACHAPLFEQAALIPDTLGQLVRNPSFERELQREGLTCAACHLRGWRRHGPPRRDGSVDGSPPGAPHGGAVRTPFFENSRFCAGCHQFVEPAPNGKSLQDTFSEWRQSRYARQGVGCQHCHMPDRRHLWRGIHDSAMVGGGMSIEWVREGGAVGLEVGNRATGHRFPTYVTPRIRVRVELLDHQREPLEGGHAEGVIGREVVTRAGIWVETWDSRLPPDSSMTVAASVRPRARYARGVITVFPDGFYNGMFSRMLAGQLSDTSRALIREAHRRTRESIYVIFDSTITLR